MHTGSYRPPSSLRLEGCEERKGCPREKAEGEGNPASSLQELTKGDREVQGHRGVFPPHSQHRRCPCPGVTRTVLLRVTTGDNW